MNIIDTITAVEASTEFAHFKAEQPDAYLVHAFAMEAPGDEPSWQLGYCLPISSRIVVFTADPIKRQPEDEAFTKGEAIKPLDMAAVKIDGVEAMERVMAFQRERYSIERATRIIIILQHLDRQLYNCTLVTNNFNTINIRLDARTGEVYEHAMKSIMSLRQSEEADEK